MTEMTEQEQIQALLAGGGTELPNNPLKDAEALRAYLADYNAPRGFEPGTIVRPKLGLCATERRYQKLALIYVRTLDVPQEVFFPRYFNLNCVVGTLDSEGDMQLYLNDSGRLEAYPQEELEALGLEAAKAVN